MKIQIFIAISILVVLIIRLYYLIQNDLIQNENFNNQSKNYQGLNRVEMIGFINLDNRPDRLKLIENQLRSHDIDRYKIKKFPGHYTPKNGHIGCARSHLDVLEYANQNNLKNILILEDDFQFAGNPKETHQTLNKFFDQIPSDEWDVVFLTHGYGKLSPTAVPFLNKINDAVCGAGYLVNQHYYPQMIANLEESLANLREDIFEGQYCFDQLWHKLQAKDNWFFLIPPVGIHDFETKSTILETLPEPEKK